MQLSYKQTLWQTLIVFSSSCGSFIVHEILTNQRKIRLQINKQVTVTSCEQLLYMIMMISH